MALRCDVRCGCKDWVVNGLEAGDSVVCPSCGATIFFLSLAPRAEACAQDAVDARVRNLPKVLRVYEDRRAEPRR